MTAKTGNAAQGCGQEAVCVKARVREKKSRPPIVPALFTVAVIAAMTAVSELLNDPEIIFPEIAALAVGYLCAPKRSWQVTSARMFLLIAGCALLGLLISLYFPGHLYGKVLFAFVIAQIVYMYSGTSLAPLISAVVLPVLIGTKEVSYLISAAVMTALIIALRQLLVRLGYRRKEPFAAVARPGRMRWNIMIIRTAVAAVLLAPAVFAGWRYIAAPPLLVAFTELSENWKPESPLKPWRVIALLTGGAVVGAGTRFLLTMTMGLPLTFSAAVAASLILAVLYRTRLFMPPAGAITILAMLIPEADVALYPLQAGLGICVYMFASVLIEMQRRMDDK